VTLTFVVAGFSAEEESVEFDVGFGVCGEPMGEG
jgi:hypothetical protein